MLILKDAINGIGPLIPKELENKIRFVANFPLLEREAKLFTIAFNALETQLKYEKKSEIMRVVCIISEYGSYTMSMDDNQLGSQHAVCLYAVGKWRTNKYNDYQILTIILEELAHHFWAIEDETIVNYQVLKIFKRIDPNVKLEDLYNC